MLGADFAFHLLAKRNDIAVGNNTHFVCFLDAAFFVFGGVAGFRAGGNVVDLRRRGVEAVGFDTQEIAFGFECVEQGIQMRLDGGFAAGNDDVARRVGFQTAQNIGQAHHAEFEVVGIAPAAREIAFAQTDENGGYACIPAFTLQAFKDFDNAVLGIVRSDVNGHECRVWGFNYCSETFEEVG